MGNFKSHTATERVAVITTGVTVLLLERCNAFQTAPLQHTTSMYDIYI